MANLAYVRVSTVEQNEERQLENLKRYGIEKWFIEKISAKDTNRPQLNAMLDYAREGDKIFIHDSSRLARSTKDLLEIIDYLQKKSIILVSSKDNIDTSTPTGKLMLTLIGAINEFERTNLLERQREGIAIAKAKVNTRAERPFLFQILISIMSDICDVKSAYFFEIIILPSASNPMPLSRIEE